MDSRQKHAGMTVIVTYDG